MHWMSAWPIRNKYRPIDSPLLRPDEEGYDSPQEQERRDKAPGGPHEKARLEREKLAKEAEGRRRTRAAMVSYRAAERQRDAEHASNLARARHEAKLRRSLKK
jgi:hypothetical protein